MMAREKDKEERTRRKGETEEMASGEDVYNLVAGLLKKHKLVGPLVDFLGGAANGLTSLYEDKKAFDRLLTSFLFDKKDSESLNLLCTKDAELNYYLQDEDEDYDVFTRKEFKDPVPPGWFELHGLFQAKKEPKDPWTQERLAKVANELEFALHVHGMIPLDVILRVAQELIKGASSEDFSLNGASVKAGLLKLFPKMAEELRKVIDLDNTDIDIEQGEGFVKVHIDGYVDIGELKRNYRALNTLVQHIRRLRIKLLSAENFGEGFDNSDSGVPGLVNDSLKLWELVLENNGTSNVPFQITFCLDRDGSGLLFMDGNGKPVPGKRALLQADLRQEFVVSLDSTYRIKELGCASIQLPLVVLRLSFVPEKEKLGTYERHGFNFYLLHLDQTSFLTRTLVRPFISIPVLRKLMLKRLFVTVGILTSEKDPTTAELSVAIRIPLLPPPTLLLSCVSLFVRRQVQAGDGLLLGKNLLAAAAEDLASLNV